MSQDFTENKRYLWSFKNVSAAMIIVLLMTVSYCVGHYECMRTAAEKGKAVKTEYGYRWVR